MPLPFDSPTIVTLFIIGIILFTITFNFFLSFISQVTYIHYVILSPTKAKDHVTFFFHFIVEETNTQRSDTARLSVQLESGSARFETRLCDFTSTS